MKTRPGSTYTTTNKESVMADYDKEQKAACEAWNVELLTDIFPQADEFTTPDYSPDLELTQSRRSLTRLQISSMRSHGLRSLAA
ncbi:MAG: hypothetical protein ACLR7N_12350 [Roseburia hominis]